MSNNDGTWPPPALVDDGCTTYFDDTATQRCVECDEEVGWCTCECAACAESIHECECGED